VSAEQPCALVTGAGRGLGRAIAETFHDEGYQVVATDYDVDLLADLAGEEGYTVAVLDVTSDENADEVAAMIAKDIGHLEVLVNNAGIMSFYPVCEAPTELTVNTFDINTFGPVRTIRACLDLLEDSQGRIVNISSESAPLRSPFQSYASSKMALEALSDAMRRELSLLGVHLALVRPGAIQTELYEEVHHVTNEIENSRFENFFKRFAKGVARRAPQNPSTPAEVAAVVYEAATDADEKPMYEINNSLAIKIAGYLPTRMLDKLLTTELGRR
jgi:NAD(P)-dependent dehydrogenase (short-subunit alcohol dehydrogenase family)